MTSCHVTRVTLSNATLLPRSGTPDMRMTARKGLYQRLNHQWDRTEIRVKTKNTAILRGPGAVVSVTHVIKYIYPFGLINQVKCRYFLFANVRKT